MKQYVDSGKIRYAVIDTPLPMHPLAPKAAEASRCAADQGKFWEMHGQLMSNQAGLANLESYANQLKLDVARFNECLKTNKYSDEVNKDLVLASKLNISGVPGFIIAQGDLKNPTKVKGISFIPGAQPLAIFMREIEQALAGLSEPKK
jgi:protein-disulfide isomerase